MSEAGGVVIESNGLWWSRTALSPRSSRTFRGRTRRSQLARRATIGCLLVGFVSVGTSVPVGAVARVGWSVVPSPNEGPASSTNRLDGVSCASTSTCTAVGFTESKGGVYKTLVESWDGTSWSGVPSPSEGPASSDDGLGSVSCASASSCTAVGGYRNKGGVYKTLVESSDGTSWSVVPSPNEGPASSTNLLGGVSCASTRTCTAVGFTESKGGVSKTLVESWDGTSWSGVPSPNEGPASSSNLFYGVSCASTRTCTAVGFTESKGGVSKTLVESWDGTSWSGVPSPNEGPASSSNLFYGVSCASTRACTAVGFTESKGGVYKTLVESWDGTRWSVVPTPNEGPASSNNLLDGVSCALASSCTSVGYYRNKGGAYKTLVESWDGTRWSVVPTPNEGPASNDNLLDGVSCASPSSCAAVGRQNNRSVDKTLVETS